MIFQGEKVIGLALHEIWSRRRILEDKDDNTTRGDIVQFGELKFCVIVIVGIDRGVRVEY